MHGYEKKNPFPQDFTFRLLTCSQIKSNESSLINVEFMCITFLLSMEKRFNGFQFIYILRGRGVDPYASSTSYLRVES